MMNSPLARRTRIGLGRPNLWEGAARRDPAWNCSKNERCFRPGRSPTTATIRPIPARCDFAILNEPDGTTINFAPSVGKEITLSNGPLNITTNLEIEGGSVPGINGNFNGTVFGIASGKTVAISGLGIGNGEAIDGGGINNAGTLTLSHCNIGGNFATNAGGGIYNSGVLTITNCLLTSNSVKDGRLSDRGGGIYNAGTLTVNNCQFVNNSTARFDLDPDKIKGGGGIFNEEELTVNNSSFSRNVGSNGGGILNNSRATVTNSSFALNKTSVDQLLGGGTGGGIMNSWGRLTLVNCTLAGNEARGTGGISNGGGLTIVNCTIYQNRSFNRLADDCGGLSNALLSRVSLVNTIIAQNSGGVPDVAGEVNSQGYNLIGNTKGSNGWVGVDLLNVRDPLLAHLGDYGGSTLTMPPLPGSPAIGLGNPAAITNPPFPGPPPLTDQRGLPRIVNGKVDIGACESQGYIITVVSGDNQATKVGTAFAAPLVVSVASAYGEPVNGGVVSFFQSPGSRASCTFPSGKPNVTIYPSGIDNTGRATIRVAADTTAGSYTVQATTISFAASAYFNLTNTAGTPIGLPLARSPRRRARPGSRSPVNRLSSSKTVTATS